jgi:alkanesulfonate monooxygenase SsuD/methylene tetrahydromethanopterin reductase-like flavin-dependent oxidoreductase (luciferase family)
VKFGIFSMTHAPVDTPHAEIYRRFVEIATEAERLGFWSIWTTEHHFTSSKSYWPFGVSPQEYSPVAEYDINPDPLPLLAFAAAKTSRIQLGTAVVVVPWDHPVRTTERAAMLDVLSGGRVELGVGRGSPTREGPVFGVPADPEDADRRFKEGLELIRKAWGGRPFDHDGEFYAVPPGLELTPTPIQSKAPLWIGSASNDSAVWAAEQGLPYATIAWPLMLMEEYKAKHEVYLAAAAANSVDVADNENIVLLYTYCGESEDEAAETSYHYMKQFQYINEQHYELLRDEKRFGMYLEMTGYKTPENWVHQNAMYSVDNHMIGTADTIVERLKFHEEDLGLKYILMNHGWGLMPQAKALASMRRISQHVMPHFSQPRVSASAGVA